MTVDPEFQRLIRDDPIDAALGHKRQTASDGQPESEASYTVVVSREGSNWLADVPTVPGAHTWAPSLAELLVKAREVIVLMANLPDDAQPRLTVDVSAAQLSDEDTEDLTDVLSVMNRENRTVKLPEIQAALAADDDAFVLHLSDGTTTTWGELRQDAELTRPNRTDPFW